VVTLVNPQKRDKMSGRLLLVLMMGAALGSLGQTAQDVTTVRAAVAKIETLARKVRKSHVSQGRRLQSMPDVDFGKLCTSKCWTAIKTSVVKMVDDMEKNCGAGALTNEECKKPGDTEKDGTGAPADPAPKEENQQDSPCLFDMGKMPMGPLGTLADACKAGVVKSLGPDTIYKMDLCTLSTFGFVCTAVLGDCATDNTQERKLFCQAPSADDKPEDPPNCDNPPDSEGDAMVNSFNQMCAYNPTGKFYCQQKAAAWQKKGAFKDEPEVLFPNPCDIDCNKPTGKAILEMGCCMGQFIAGGLKGSGMSAKAFRSAKAAVFKCGGMKAMEVCTGALSGMITPTKIFAGKQSVATCPATDAAEKETKAALAKTLAVSPGSLSLVACVPADSSCEGGNRRMAASTSTINYAVKVTGSTTAIAAKEKAVKAKIAANNAPAVDKTGATTGATTAAKDSVTAGCGSVSLSLGILVLSFLASCAM